MEEENILLVVAGPTAVGKTELCLRLATYFDTEIVSADSRQFYQELNIGTAKPTLAELAAVKHYFINSHSLTEPYNSGAYENDALALLQNLFKTKKRVILTGGSGLYIKAVCEGLDEMPPVNGELRTQLTDTWARDGLPALVARLKDLDPVYYAKVDLANPQRVIRALEVCLSSGQPYSSFRKKKRASRPFKTVKVGLTRDRATLYNRIDQRMDKMLADGLAEEARRLYAYREHNALQTVGYQEIFDFLAGKQDWDETVRLLKRNSRRYAKRQFTWFTRDPGFKWFHPDDWEEILAYIAQASNTNPEK